jgi:hypothetical protein
LNIDLLSVIDHGGLNLERYISHHGVRNLSRLRNNEGHEVTVNVVLFLGDGRQKLVCNISFLRRAIALLSA